MYSYEKKEKQILDVVKSIADPVKRSAQLLVAKALLKNYKGDDACVTFEEIYKNVKELPEREAMKFGHPTLDKYLDGGLRRGEVLLFTGSTNMGKTAYCFDLIRNMEEYNPFLLPFEEPAEELAEKCIRYGTPPPKFYTPKKIVREDIEWIEERILEAKLKYGSKVVFIDNLHYVTMTDSDAFVKTGMFVKKLKEIAYRLELGIVLIAHLRKCGIEKMPTYEDISGDSDAIKTAHKIVSIWQECKKKHNGEIERTGITKIITQKIRGAYGEKGVISFTWEKGVYTEMTAEQLVQQMRDYQEKNKGVFDF